MKEQAAIIEKRDVIIVGGILALMLIIGSIWDYPVSLALHDASNPFGLFFAAYGEAPATLGLIMSGALLIAARNRRNRTTGMFQMLCGAGLILAGSAMLVKLPRRYITFSAAVTAAITVAIVAAVVFLSIRLSRDASRSDVIKVAVTIFIVILLELWLVNLIKIPWGRPRMRLIATGTGAEFTPWWVIGGGMKRELMAAGVKADEFKSFPSGHTASGTVLILLSLLPVLNRAWRDKKRLLFYIGVVWGGLVAFSRIIMGAHFITDTVVGFALTLAIAWVVTNRMFVRAPGVKHRPHAVVSRSWSD